MIFKRLYSFDVIVKNLIKSGRLEIDKSQEYAVNYLNKLTLSLENRNKSWWVTGKDKVKGAYIYGSVGSGKTMLMDLFYENVRVEQKCRFHFNQFMLKFHSDLRELRDEGKVDPMKELVDRLCKDLRLLCLDEFQVTDIADAMILRKLLTSFIDCGMTIITTSNRIPDDLYLNGLHRASFIPCIELIKSSLEVINLSSETDYRGKNSIESTKRFFSNSDDSIVSLFKEMCPDAKALELNVFGRIVKVPSGLLGNCALFSYQELFEESKSAADYIEITRSFTKIFITGIPEIDSTMRNQTRRFITFIDQVYESKAELFLQSEVDLIKNLERLKSELLSSYDESFSLNRTISRLKEIKAN